MPAPLSRDLCEKVIIKHFRDDDSSSKIAQDLVIHRNTVGRVIDRWEAGEDICLSRQRGFYSRALDTRTFAVLLRLLQHDEQLFLDEIRDELLIRTGKDVSLATVCRGLREARYTSLKVRWPDPWPIACGLCL